MKERRWVVAISERQIRVGFIMLEVPYAGPLTTIDSYGLNAVQYAALEGVGAAQTLLRNWFVNLNANDPTTAALVVEIIDSFDALRPARSVDIQAGGVGDVQGLNFSVSSQMSALKKELQVLVPFYSSLGEIMSGGGENRNISVCC